MSIELVREIDPPPVDLVTEANHRIANHLAILAGLLRMESANISKQQDALPAEEIRVILEEVGARLETVAEVHRLLARGQNGALIDIDAYLENTTRGIVSGLSMAGETNLCCDLRSGGLLPSEKASLLGLLVSELVTNAVKYAHPAEVAGIIKIASVSHADGTIEIIVSDDGVGLPDGFDPLASNGMGFRMIKTLAAQVGASIAFDNHGLGLNCILKMPCAERSENRLLKGL